jgi:hypothetical protein
MALGATMMTVLGSKIRTAASQTASTTTTDTIPRMSERRRTFARLTFSLSTMCTG